jgi:hypothetical protein
VGTLEEGIVVDGEGDEVGRRSSRLASVGTFLGDASVNAREIGTGRKDTGRGCQESNTVESD